MFPVAVKAALAICYYSVAVVDIAAVVFILVVFAVVFVVAVVFIVVVAVVVLFFVVSKQNDSRILISFF